MGENYAKIFRSFVTLSLLNCLLLLTDKFSNSSPDPAELRMGVDFVFSNFWDPKILATQHLFKKIFLTIFTIGIILFGNKRFETIHFLSSTKNFSTGPTTYMSFLWLFVCVFCPFHWRLINDMQYMIYNDLYVKCIK